VTVLPRPSDTARHDAELADVALAASGDAQAFERLYRAHVARIYSLACRMVGVEEADESTQDVFVRAWEKLSLFRGEAGFGTWLYRLGINVLLARRTRRARDRARVHDGETVLESLSEAAPVPEIGIDFEAAIGRLPEGARRVFVLHDVEGFKHHEIAGMLGVTPGTSKAQLHRARMALRAYVDR